MDGFRVYALNIADVAGGGHVKTGLELFLGKFGESRDVSVEIAEMWGI